MTQYLKKVIRGKDTFVAQFTSGATTMAHDVACFFTVMQDKGVPAADLGQFINMGELVDSSVDWKKVRRIAATFTKAEGAAA